MELGRDAAAAAAAAARFEAIASDPATEFVWDLAGECAAGLARFADSASGGRSGNRNAFKSPLQALLAEARGAQADRAPCPAAALEMLRGGDAAMAVNAVADAAAEAAGGAGGAAACAESGDRGRGRGGRAVVIGRAAGQNRLAQEAPRPRGRHREEREARGVLKLRAEHSCLAFAHGHLASGSREGHVRVWRASGGALFILIVAVLCYRRKPSIALEEPLLATEKPGPWRAGPFLVAVAAAPSAAELLENVRYERFQGRPCVLPLVQALGALAAMLVCVGCARRPPATRKAAAVAVFVAAAARLAGQERLQAVSARYAAAMKALKVS